MEDFEKHWNIIMLNFDWAKVHTTFVKLEWEWRDEIPTIGTIVLTARSLCLDAYNWYKEHNVTSTASTGGLRAQFSEDGMALIFIVEEFDTYDQ